MLARARSSALALAALLACALARPDTTSFYGKRSYNPTNYTPVKGGGKPVNINAVQTISAPSAQEPQPVDTRPANPAPLTPTSESEAKVVEEADPALFRDTTTPVNKRYPHAVLFGGTCGGSIIHPKWILTAGHCTLFTGGRYVLAGTNNSDDGSGVTKKVKKLHVHPLFSVGPYWLNANNFGIKQVAARWDFMLAELEEPLELDGVTMAAAPLDDRSRLPPNTYVGYAGYGTDHHGGFMRPEMHAMHLQVRSDAECAALEQYSSKDMLCAKGYAPNFDSACNGDSGSGLVGDGKLLGIASWVQNDAFECANGNLVVFSKVASVRDWIRKISGV